MEEPSPLSHRGGEHQLLRTQSKKKSSRWLKMQRNQLDRSEKLRTGRPMKRTCTRRGSLLQKSTEQKNWPGEKRLSWRATQSSRRQQQVTTRRVADTARGSAIGEAEWSNCSMNANMVGRKSVRKKLIYQWTIVHQRYFFYPQSKWERMDWLFRRNMVVRSILCYIVVPAV